MVGVAALGGEEEVDSARLRRVAADAEGLPPDAIHGDQPTGGIDEMDEIGGIFQQIVQGALHRVQPRVQVRHRRSILAAIHLGLSRHPITHQTPCPLYRRAHR